MNRRLFATPNDHTLFYARIILGMIFFAHGAQKALGWFGGQGLTATIHTFGTYLHIPAPLGYLAICAEFLGGIGLVVGLLGRVAASGILVVMLVAIVKLHSQFGLFANWSGAQKGEGVEYHLLAIAICMILMVKGSGAWSLDRWIAHRKA